jgi:hypothetical protein
MGHDDLKAWFDAHKHDRSTSIAMELRQSMTPSDLEQAKIVANCSSEDEFELAIVQALTEAVESGVASSYAAFIESLKPVPVSVPVPSSTKAKG